MNDSQRGWFFIIVIVLAAAFWTWLSRVPDSTLSGSRLANPREDFPAPDFTLDHLDGGSTQLSDLRGNVVIVNLWASWCAPCRAEMPAFQKLYNANRERGLEVLAVNSTFQDSETDARNFAGQLGLTYPILLDREGVVSRQYRLQALPSTFIIDRSGIIRTVIIGGPASEATLQTQIEALLNESP